MGVEKDCHEGGSVGNQSRASNDQLNESSDVSD